MRHAAEVVAIPSWHLGWTMIQRVRRKPMSGLSRRRGNADLDLCLAVPD
jgi:hypothetical protein